MKFSINKIIAIALLAMLPAMAMGARKSKQAPKPLHVACIGNSITFGYTLDDPATQSYPSQLQVMLDSVAKGRYEVGNFGKSGATLLAKGHRPYFEQEEWARAKAFVPDIAVIHLGINDTDPRDWPEYSYDFAPDYLKLVDTLRMINPDVRVIIANLSPINAKHPRFDAGTRVWRNEIRELIPEIAEVSGAELIDFDTPLADRQHLLPDGLHPNYEGATRLARTVYSAMTGDYGGLQLPEIYSDGMILQRDRYLPVRGTADAGEKVTVTIDGQTYTTVADNRGDWMVTLRPLVTGPSYHMTVSTPSRTININDILAGEVWMASGQSNMAFMNHQADTTEVDWRTLNDPKLRFFDMKPIELTNDYVWPDSSIAKVNDMRYYLPAKWQSATPATTPDWSAVAYHFAKALRDSLDVPVGVISNSVGGSTTESWVDIHTLEDGFYRILLNWDTNHFGHPWAQQRSRDNVVDTKKNRHPYDPSYLFTSAVRSTGAFPIRGAIWYQGESNEKNIETHEALFRLLVKSWREYYNDPELPIHMVQLSSILRPSWPWFRDSQRRLAKEIPGVAMAVSSDYGDEWDVHPRHKRPVGRRLAFTALRDVYGHNLVAEGPLPGRVTMDNGALVVEFDNATELTTSDGEPIRTFEIAETEALYRPAQVKVEGNKIILTNPDMENPKFVRYGWQPYTTANMVNEVGLPASTFKAEAENSADTDIEPGIDKGVSACFAGTTADGKVLMAGGCNFPEDPLGKQSQKRFYKGIYVADGDDMEWRRVGSLDAPTAYGVYAPAAEGVVIIGGTTPDAALATVQLLKVDGDDAQLIQLPSLPVTVDNAYAASIGSKVYVAGGNQNGKPSNDLWMLDMADTDKGWTRLAPMPGEPRVQPVMAEGKAASGEVCLWLWGGFAGKGEGREASLQTSGLCYTPSSDSWTPVVAPMTASGEDISTGGGVAVTLSDGRIAVAGGVNKDVFLEALRNQAPDYLMHEPAWYCFNPYLLIFNPRKGKWEVKSGEGNTARAGAAAVAGPARDLYIMGGELKPRIRTNETLHVKL